MEARWTIRCDGIAWRPSYRCPSIVRGEEGEATGDLALRAAKSGWTHDLRTGQDFCTAKHLQVEGGDPTP